MPELIVPVLTGWGLSATAASIVANLGVSVALTAIRQAIARSQQGAADASREIARPDSLPPHRHVYGRGVRVQGSPAPLWVVKDSVLYGCIILNSRPSDGSNFALFLDRRAVGLSGDIYDFGEHQTGTATVAAGNTYVDVTHGLSGAPIGDGMAAWVADGPVTVSTLGATQLRITLDDPAPTGGTEVTWRAVKGTNGGAALNEPFNNHVNVWFGCGDQAHPPARILEEVGDLRSINTSKFWATDRWFNCTVLWVRLVAGDAGQRADRWPSTPPLIEVQADWSPVWDPRDESQDPDDPTTWTVRDNQALCLLDSLRQNPIARYDLSQIRLQDFIDAADLADELVRLKAGGAERRYRVGCLIAYQQGVELADSIQPLELAGAGSLVRVGGTVGYAPGSWEAPEVTLDECLRDAPVQFQRTSPTRDLPGALVVEHPDPAANWETSDEQPYQVDPDWDGSSDRITSVSLAAVFSRTQAQRVQKILAERRKLQKKLTATFSPAALQAIAGGRATLALERVADRRNGDYRVVQSHPAQWLENDEGVALRLPLSLEEDAAAVYAWDPDTDEVERPDQLVIPADPTVDAPSWDSASATGSTIDFTINVPGEIVQELPSEEFWFHSAVEALDLRYRRNQEPFFLPMQEILCWDPGPRSDEQKDGILLAAQSGSSYDFQVRGRIDDRYGEWVTFYAVQVGFTLGAPTGASATPGSGQIAISATAPSDTPCAGVQFWVATEDDPEAAILYAEVACDPSDPVSYTATGLPAGVLHYLFVRAITDAGAVSPWATTLTATPT
ncbi:phage tail protein [Cereibacter sphaeroides]|nr:phage tail protein [Cereibacter sphaeroides]